MCYTRWAYCTYHRCTTGIVEVHRVCPMGIVCVYYRHSVYTAGLVCVYCGHSVCVLQV